jgi:hypothetical protein
MGNDSDAPGAVKMEPKKLQRLERKVLRRDAQEAVRRLPNAIGELQARLQIALQDHPNDEQVFEIVTDAIKKIDALIAEKPSGK